MLNTSVGCETCRIIHQEPFVTQDLAELIVGEPHEEVTGHSAMYVTTDNLPAMLLDIYSGNEIPDDWKLGMLRIIAEE